MILTFYPHKDSTIYEQLPTVTTETDSVLELIHEYDGIKSNNSRILLQFSNQEISDSIEKYSISAHSYFLQLKSVTIDELPIESTLNFYALSESWNAGTGFFDSNPKTTNGASWQYRTSLNIDPWDTNENNSEYLYVSGGASWIPSSLISKTLYEKDKDLFINVTDIFNKFETGEYQNNGILIKYTGSFESSSYPYSKLQYFSRNSNTIYSPKLFIVWDDSSFSTGSLNEIDIDNEFVVYSKLNQEYNQSDVAKIRLNARPKYIQKVYSTESLYLVNYALPETTYYEIRDSVTNDVIIPFNETGSKISCDATGNYFLFHMDNLQPERYYKFIYKVTKDRLQLIVDTDQYFKVVR